VAVTNDVICGLFLLASNRASGLQHHVDAILEEQLNAQWIVLDRARVYSSEQTNTLSPPNEGVTGAEGDRNFNQFTFVTGLQIDGPSVVQEGAPARFTALAQLSNNTTNPVAVLWSADPPFSIDANGILVSGAITSNRTIQVTATHIHSIQTLTANLQVTFVNLPEPAIVFWDDPADIEYRTPLSATQLNATANVAGTFVYFPPARTILPAGIAQPLSVTFTPLDAAAYLPTNRTVHLTVLRARQTISFPLIPDKLEDDRPFTPPAFAYSDLPVTLDVVSGPAQMSGELVQLTGLGLVTLRATQGGDNDYWPADPVERSFTVRKHMFQLASFEVRQGSFRCILRGAPNHNYLLLVTSDLVNWAAIATNRADATGTLAIQVPWFVGESFKAYQSRSVP
jgi:hypothetical protein